MNDKLLWGLSGSVLSAVGAGLSLEQIQQIISIICTCVGFIITIVSVVIIPLIKHIKKAKEDGEISPEEVEEAVNIINNGIEEIKDSVNKNKQTKKGDYMTHAEIINALKETLKANLNDNNVKLFAEIDKSLDSLSDSHSKTEQELSSLKDDYIKVVKETSFVVDKVEDPNKGNTDKPLSVDEALQQAIDEELKANKEE